MIKLSEKQFSRQVCDLARVFGWKVYKTWISIHSPAGFPDLVLVRPPQLIFAELKSERGKLSLAQAEWIDALGRSGSHQVYIWRPSDFEIIERTLRRHSLRPRP